MIMNAASTKSLRLWFLFSLLGAFSAAGQQCELPKWFDEHRVQAHFENKIEDDLSGLYTNLHPAIHGMGAEVLTRIFKTVGEGAWWPTEAGYTHELLEGRDLGREIASDAHRQGLKVFAYYRIMCDDLVEKEHPEWLCRDAEGNLVLEPRTRRSAVESKRKHVICFNSPAREQIKTRLLELADRSVDGIYFDSWHMPEVCTCPNCRSAYLKETGRAMTVSTERGSEEYQRNAGFVARSIVRNFREWKQAVREKHPDVMFAIGSSLYPCFDSQMQITAVLLEISDTSKTEFAKPFGGFLGWPVTDGRLVTPNRRRAYLEDSFALPTYDLQNALGWSLTRDSCAGRPPLMWVPHTRTEQEVLFSAAAAVSYGCIASVHPMGLFNRRDSSINIQAVEQCRAAYALGGKVSPQLASTRPLRFALLHISERSRNARISDPCTLWTEFFAPALGAFEAFKEEHLPVATINDLQLERTIPAETRVVILPHASELIDSQRTMIREFESAGGTVLRLDADQGWHLRSEKPRLKQELVNRLAAANVAAPIRARGPAAMHAVFHKSADGTKTVACLVNDFGWFRTERDVDPARAGLPPPPLCTGVEIEIPAGQPAIRHAFEAVTGTELDIRREDGKTVIAVPDFPVTACIVLE